MPEQQIPSVVINFEQNSIDFYEVNLLPKYLTLPECTIADFKISKVTLDGTIITNFASIVSITSLGVLKVHDFVTARSVLIYV